MDVNVQIAFFWTALSVISGALAGGMVAYHFGKRAGVREYHEARERKSALTRARKKARNAPRAPIGSLESAPQRGFAVPRGVDMGEGEE